jgi:uncharacterized protein YebE (UPF0316 family)
MAAQDLALPLLIFGLRILNNGMGTVRLIVMTYGRRRLVFVLAFLESLVFAITIAQVANDLSDVPNLIAYCGGFAVGGYLGMWLEDRFVTGYMTINIIARDKGHDLAVAMRLQGYAVTETVGEGIEGKVTMLRCVVLRRQVSDVSDLVQTINPNSFITVEEARAVHRGWMNNRIVKQL